MISGYFNNKRGRVDLFRGIINTRKDAFLRSQPDKASGKTMAYKRGSERYNKSGKAFTPTIVLVNKPDQNIHFLVDSG